MEREYKPFGVRKRNLVVAKVSPEFKDCMVKLREFLREDGIDLKGMPALSRKAAWIVENTIDQAKRNKEDKVTTSRLFRMKGFNI